MTKTATKARSQDLATNPQNQVATASPIDMSAMGGMGLDKVASGDILIPRLTVLQKISPQLDESSPDYIEDAKAGMICDTATGQSWDSILLLPCYYAKVYLEWAPRSSGKGLVKNHGLDSSILNECTRDEKNRTVTSDGNLVAETATYFVLNLTADGRRSFVPLASTQLKAARRWMTAITSQRDKRADGTEYMPPIFFRSWQATTVKQQNSEGAWFGWKFEPATSLKEMPAEEAGTLLLECTEFYEMARDGLVQGDLRDVAEEQAGETTESSAM